MQYITARASNKQMGLNQGFHGNEDVKKWAKSILKLGPRAYHIMRGPGSAKQPNNTDFYLSLFNIPPPHPRSLNIVPIQLEVGQS